MPEPTPDLRPFWPRLLDRLLHVRREPPPCQHCEHVTELRATVRIHNRLLFVVIGAVVTVIVRWAIADISARLRWVDPGPPASLVGSDSRK